jgi:hypothetical protein
MSNKKSEITKFLLRNDYYWCKLLNIYNPYSDPWPVRISKNVPDFDGQAFKKYYEHNYVYDKLWIAQSQGLVCGKLDKNINPSTFKNIEFPIFIKPRWGHKSATSKNCFKINTYEDLNEYIDLEEMMWCEYLDDREGMTDFFVQNGNIVHQITYVYSEKQMGSVADEWKYIDGTSKPDPVFIDWVNRHMNGYSGVCNVQYRGDKIIEVSLRLARGGAYIYSTNNINLINNINNLVDNNRWNNHLDLSFKPFYSFKCYTNCLFIYVYPQFVMNQIMKWNNCKEFHEYYFEPSGKEGMVFFQFVHNDLNEGIKIKENIELLFYLTQLFFYLLIIITILALLFDKKIGCYIFIIILLLYMNQYLNPFFVHYNLWKIQKLSMLS